MVRWRTTLALIQPAWATTSNTAAAVPAAYRHNAHHWLILHGRYVCTARSPQCSACTVRAVCDTGAQTAQARPR